VGEAVIGKRNLVVASPAALIATLIASLGAAAHPARRPPADLTGSWSNASLTTQERPDDFKTLAAPEAEAAKYEKAHRGKPPDVPPEEDPADGVHSEWWETDQGLARIRGQARTSWIVSPADGKRPFTAAAKAANKANEARAKTSPDNPEDRMRTERCIDDDGVGPPLDNGGYNDNYAFVQTARELAIYGEWQHSVRVIRFATPGAAEARHPPPDVRLPMGDSVGHWDGATLVVETTNFTPGEVKAPSQDPRADMRVVERFTRLSPTEIFYEYAVTNPARFVQTWRAEQVLHPANGMIYEVACHEGNYGLSNMLAAARRLEGRKVQDVAVGR
jgi:hypothetical protein